ncbi:hypothetical protein ACGXZQ_003993 [Escherichia albertii]|uniref:hypothetical protein n=1 Tax=Escherichia albertii TaxID=208962 RepID=UPI0021D410A6|nr:hypothetical protein [Escherichia albertii]EJM0810054.1 hypothetical protein [Escherichia albertii]EJM1768666.1 hypothetical protein [Escherichia albertii]EJM2114583.1 hypothetical protein [Escherichia albertii]EJO0119100.1 hypothetical protein [Escherichia albertii]MCU7315795.1 hypothetical protein [Escherichia albertii]
MGMQASIDVTFQKRYSPKFVLKTLLTHGWSINYDNHVVFLLPSNKDDYDWQRISILNFNFARFLAAHHENDRIGITLVNEGVGGEVIINPDFLTISQTINRVYVNDFKCIVNFSWYLNKISSLFCLTNVSAIDCSLIY